MMHFSICAFLEYEWNWVWIIVLGFLLGFGLTSPVAIYK